jgi:hypothetical protein
MGHYKYSKPGLLMKGLFRVLGSPYLIWRLVRG